LFSTNVVVKPVLRAHLWDK